MRVKLDWRDFAILELNSGMLVVTDPMLFPGSTFELEPGRYLVSVACATQEGEEVIARLKVCRAGIVKTRAEKSGDVIVDFAQVTVGDHAAMEAAGKSIRTPQDAQRMLDVLARPDLMGFVPWDLSGQVTTPYVRTPDGDGEFPIYQLVSGSQIVGIEVVFLDQ